MSLIEASFSRSRTTLLLLLFLFVAGASAYVQIPKEAEPDVNIPNVYVSVTHEGISPGDAERLLVRPLEQELQSIEGLKELRATAAEGFASIMLEFDAGFDADRALRDVREQVDLARPELPADSDEPRVQEINVALFPVLTAVLSGPVAEATLVELARKLQDRIESLPGVLEVDIGGNREEVVNVIVDPTVMETYRLSYADLFNFVQNNNRLVAAGSLDTGSGRFAVKVPGVIENLDDVLKMPVKVDGDRVITVDDIARIEYTFKDPDGFARVDGEAALSLEVSKRLGENIIETVEAVRALIDEERGSWPANVKVEFLQDKSDNIRTTLSDLQNNILTAVLLVMLVIILALGLRPALLVGVAIPGSFLVGILVIKSMGLTLNIVSLFSLILVVGMLVDGAIVVVELADRNLRDGMSPKAAYAEAARRMSWPIIASTATTLAVFFPLLFWPGMVGEFMKYLPITVIVCLGASLAMALVFVPVLGATLTSQSGDGELPESVGGPLIRGYTRLLAWTLQRPGKVLTAALVGLVVAYGLFGVFGKGTEFFPEQDPDYAQVHVRARGDLSIVERDALVRKVESRLFGMQEVESIYSRTLGGGSGGSDRAADVIGNVQLKFVEWDERRPIDEILEDVRMRTGDVPGVIIEARTESGGPTTGKPVVLEVSSSRPELLPSGAEAVRKLMRELGGFVDVEDDRPLPGSEWRVTVDRAEAARFDADIAMLGNVIKLVTNGIKLTDYRPESADDEVDIRLRFADADRHLGELDQLRLITDNGSVPISNFVTVAPAQKTGTLQRIDGRRVLTVKADVKEGLLVNERIVALRTAIDEVQLPPGVQITFSGQDEDQREAMTFLVNAFLAAIALMTIFLVTQFNSIYQALLVLTAIVFSTAGILIGLLVTQQPFGIVMCGIGVIALAGIVVNNNIILIDTYNAFRSDGMNAVQAALETGALRARPVVLTASTTVLGLLPMVFAINPDFIAREITVGAPSTQLWTQLASSIAGGLTVATLLTLVLTPCLLVLGERAGGRLRSGYARVARGFSGVGRRRHRGGLASLLIVSVATLTSPDTARAAPNAEEDACLAKVVRAAAAAATAAEIRGQCLARSDNVAARRDEPAADTSPSMILQRMQRERAMGGLSPVLVPHNRNYVLPVSYVREPNVAPFRNAFGDILPEENLDNVEAKFQVSLKYSLADNLLLDNDELFLGFTATSFWQVYNKDVSAPFRETNYEPEIFWAAPLDWRPFNANASLAVLGFSHQSNGQAGTLSRSWNRLYANFIIEKNRFVFSLKPWWRIPEDRKSDPLDARGDDNPDIHKYMGYFELATLYRYRNHDLTLMLRNNLRSNNRGAVQLEWTFPMWRGIRGYAQYFNGYGESLIDYNAHIERFGVGFLLTDLI